MKNIKYKIVEGNNNDKKNQLGVDHKGNIFLTQNILI